MIDWTQQAIGALGGGVCQIRLAALQGQLGQLQAEGAAVLKSISDTSLQAASKKGAACASSPSGQCCFTWTALAAQFANDYATQAAAVNGALQAAATAIGQIDCSADSGAGLDAKVTAAAQALANAAAVIQGARGVDVRDRLTFTQTLDTCP